MKTTSKVPAKTVAQIRDEEAQAWLDVLTDDEREALPASRLRALRIRAGLTAAKCAEAAGMTNATTWFVYEQAKRMRDRKLPMKVVRPMLTLMVGKGSPKITADELIALSDIESVEEVRSVVQGGKSDTEARVRSVTGVFTNLNNAPTLLPIRYRVEKSVYLPAEMIATRTFGVGPIAMAADFRSEQSCCVVADDDGGTEYPAGTALHLVASTEFAQHQLIGRKVVVAKSHAAIGLGEVRLARVQAIHGNEVKLHTMRGEPIDGDILGVVVGKYQRE